MTGGAQPRVPASGGPRRAKRGERTLAALIAAGCFGVLALALLLRPASEGHGTHTGLGLPPCGWAVALNKPCPTCGMTTSFSHAAKGAMIESLRTQPLGLLLVIGTATAFWTGAHVALFGARLGPTLGLLNRRGVYLTILAVALGAWVFKIATWQS